MGRATRVLGILSVTILGVLLCGLMTKDEISSMSFGEEPWDRLTTIPAHYMYCSFAMVILGLGFMGCAMFIKDRHFRNLSLVMSRVVILCLILSTMGICISIRDGVRTNSCLMQMERTGFQVSVPTLKYGRVDGFSVRMSIVSNVSSFSKGRLVRPIPESFCKYKNFRGIYNRSAPETSKDSDILFMKMLVLLVNLTTFMILASYIALTTMRYRVQAAAPDVTDVLQIVISSEV